MSSGWTSAFYNKMNMCIWDSTLAGSEGTKKLHEQVRHIPILFNISLRSDPWSYEGFPRTS